MSQIDNINARIKSIVKTINANQGVIAAIGVILLIFQISYSLGFNIFSWPAIFLGLPLESKMWYLWLINLVIIGIFYLILLNKIDRIRFTPEDSEKEKKKEIIKLFDSEIKKCEKILEDIPKLESDNERMEYLLNDLQMSQKQIFQGIPVYSQYSKEMLHFNDNLREQLIDYYDTIQTIERIRGSIDPNLRNITIFQIRSYFDLIEKARIQISELKIQLKWN